MQELFVKKFWKEENIWFYIHFQNEEAIRQIEISPKERILLTLESSQQGESILYDQCLKELDVENSDFITKEEFDKTWNNS
ncbi:hypothetical protein EG359_10400 [Chryseobacterium joostei]|uniref:EF-hand domain-containing protein n=1 Tax=Chryseobacterium joostei TaxID=112234 RepID=A0A1N7KKH3_9FLAO|nr:MULTISPECIES: hypothetical protein [Chryseobacterium]AZA77813.1 hypothetical protein EG347_09930 [Chryseobacterium sp. G0186]AZB00008.1 hypothetical protein EG359_10400 [Chryseobacterium joostei]SIS62004.1 hypothetical protein SAMN05421768_11423 [Chryseobacterium joostei]